MITTTYCDVFKEHLNYFFVGRPAYKVTLPTQAEYWELPVCLITEFDVSKAKRIFPLDTGAFKSGKFPDYISIMDIEDYEFTSIIDGPKKIVGSFFTSNDNYMKLKPRSIRDFERRFEIDILDDEIKALYKLILDSSHNYDDRRFSIEVQCSENVELTPENTLACIFPEDYLASDKFMNWIEEDLKAVTLPYQTYPFKSEFYYHAIYEKTFEFYKEIGLLR